MSIFLETSYLMRMFFRSREPHPVIPQPCSRRIMPLVCTTCIWVTIVLIWRMIICIYLYLRTLWMQKSSAHISFESAAQFSASLPRESTLVVSPMIGASNPPPADDIAQCLVGSSAAGRPTSVAPVAPLAAAGTTFPSVVDPAPTTHSYSTRLKHNINQPKVHTNGTVTYSVVRSSASEPTSHITAMEHPLWRQTLNDEF